MSLSKSAALRGHLPTGLRGLRLGLLVAASLPLFLAWAQGRLARGEDLTPVADTILQEPAPSAPAQGVMGTVGLGQFWTGVEPPVETFTIDYRNRLIVDSETSYEFGMPGPPPWDWAPLSRLEFPINSVWHGLELGVREPNWTLHFEWLTPMTDDIHGDLYDYDWMIPDADYTDLGIADQQWITGHMMDLGLDIRLWNRLFGWPVDLWSTCGFRWQRFNIMCYDARQVKWDDVWLDEPLTFDGNVIAFDQQYYLTYLGGQLRSVLNFGRLPPVSLKLQVDWANAQAYNVDHHLIREGDRYTMERTHGDSWHLGLTSEVAISRRISVGSAIDLLQIRTKGRHHHVNEPLDEDMTWTNGVRVKSDQIWLTGFIGLRF